MKLSKYIELLQKLQEEHGGDLEVLVKIRDYERLTVDYEEAEEPYPLVTKDGVKAVVVEG